MPKTHPCTTLKNVIFISPSLRIQYEKQIPASHIPNWLCKINFSLNSWLEVPHLLSEYIVLGIAIFPYLHHFLSCMTMLFLFLCVYSRQYFNFVLVSLNLANPNCVFTFLVDGANKCMLCETESCQVVTLSHFLFPSLGTPVVK